jgi:hydrogenase-4 component E
MNVWLEPIMVAIVLMNLILVASSRLSACIRIVAFQGIAVGLLFIVADVYPPTTDRLLFIFASIILKGFVFPWLLFQAIREANVRREVEPFVSYPVSVAICIITLVISIWLGARLPMPRPVLSPLVVPVALSTIFCGFFVIVSRPKALTQVLGYLVIENGIYIFGTALLLEQSVLVELAILLDIFVAVFVMGIMIFHISREFDHIDTQRLSELKD